MKTQEEFWEFIALNVECKTCPVDWYICHIDKTYFPKCRTNYSCGSTIWSLYSYITKKEQEEAIKKLKEVLDGEMETA